MRGLVDVEIEVLLLEERMLSGDGFIRLPLVEAASGRNGREKD